MLVLTRKVNQSVLIWHDDDEEPLVLTVGGEVKLNFDGSKRYKILREEIKDIQPKEKNGNVMP